MSHPGVSAVPRGAAPLQDRRDAVDAALHEALATERVVCRELEEAMRSAVFPGGKRWRPLLTLAAAELSGAEWRGAVPAAAAVELIHCSSLVFDDLPCMDDAALRRGRPTVHAAFGEGVAVLAGIGLLTKAMELLAGSSQGGMLVARAARSLDATRMLGGQGLDLRRRAGGPAAAEPPADLLNRKTTTLVDLALALGALHGRMDEAGHEALAVYAHEIGLAYQQLDDLDDGDADAPGGDAEGARARAAILARRTRAIQAIRRHFLPGEPLAFLVSFAETLVPVAAGPGGAPAARAPLRALSAAAR